MPFMSDLNESAVSDALALEALTWLNRLLSGAVTEDEAGRFQVWRGQSPAHQAAFAEALSLQRSVRAAVRARDAGHLRPPPAAGGRLRATRGRFDPARRALLVGGSAAAATAAGYAIYVRSDLLTDGLGAMTSDYRTAVGERGAVSLARGVALELNTRTRISLLKTAGPAGGVEVQAGEAMVSADRPGEAPFLVRAAQGRILVGQGQVNVRHEGGQVCVTCLGGAVEIQHRGRGMRLTPGGQVRYGQDGLGATQAVDTLVTSAWRKGLLIFRDTPLQSVVDELNRYRPGKIFLVGEALARRPVYGVFRTSQIQAAIEQIRDLTGARIVDLPGGAVLLR
jgi:transmembrane sensor